MSRRQRVGLVLSGGGVFGAFQAGFLDEVLSAGMRFDAIAGSSIGAFNAVLASNHDPRPLRHFWLNVPRRLQQGLVSARSQWVECLGLLKGAAPIARAAGVRHVASRAMFGGGLGMAAGAGISALGGPIGLGLSLVGGVVAGTGLGAMFGYSGAENAGRAAALRHIGRLLDAQAAAGPILSPRIVDALRRPLANATLRCPVWTTTADVARLSPRHILAMYEDETNEVVRPGSYRPLERQSQVETTIASMALPFLFDSQNPVNPTPWLDGGLHDNVPLDALAFGPVELDYVVVLNVSGGARDFANDRAETLRGVPVLHVGLTGRPGAAALLDFKRAPRLYELGQRAARAASRRWFANLSFDPVGQFFASPAVLPSSHTLGFPYAGAQ